MRGKFIVFEGGDGGGKDTQIERLRDILPIGEYLFVRDPGGTEIGERLREIVLHDRRVERRAEFLTYLAARAQLVEERIEPALREGRGVISHRFDLSTIAYQIYGRERLDLLAFLKELSAFALGDAKPDLVILLDMPPEVGLTRVKTARAFDRFEREELSFHERVRTGYLTHIKDYPEHYVIDATRTIEEVHLDVRRALKL